jgi:hypothetical protein
VAFLLSTFSALLVITGLAVKYVLLPWLKDHLVAPLQETHRQVSQNGHAHQASPTIPDRLEDLAEKVDGATSAHEQQARAQKALANVLDQHLQWSDRWVDVVDREIALLKDQLAKAQLHDGERRP